MQGRRDFLALAAENLTEEGGPPAGFCLRLAFSPFVGYNRGNFSIKGAADYD